MRSTGGLVFSIALQPVVMCKAEVCLTRYIFDPAKRSAEAAYKGCEASFPRLLPILVFLSLFIFLSQNSLQRGNGFFKRQISSRKHVRKNIKHLH